MVGFIRVLRILIFKETLGGDKIEETTCELCSKRISLKEHPLGLVFENSIFVCEDCSTRHTREEITKLSKTIMISSRNGMPIALWLIQQQNKDKTMMT
jgi:hypothetical protein